MWNNRTIVKALLVGLAVMLMAASCAFLVTICLSFIWLHSHSVSGYSVQQVSHDYYRLIKYLIVPVGPSLKFDFLPLSVRALQHFQSVKQVVMLIEVFVGCGFWLLVQQLIYIKKSYQRVVNMLVALEIVMTVLLVFGVLLWVNFSSMFIQIHRMLFHNRNWIFNVNQDPIISAMPTSFFSTLYCVWILLTIVFVGGLYCYLLVVTKFGFNKAYDSRNQSDHNNSNDD